MTEEILGENLIEIHQNLETFAKHHKKEGAIIVHRAIFENLNVKPEIMQESDVVFYEHREKAIKEVLQFISENFIR